MVVNAGTKPFLIQRREALLAFPDGHEFEGAEIRAKLDVDIGTFLQIQSMTENATAEETRSVFEKFGDDIVLEWNLHDEDGKPVPSNGKGFLSIPPNIATAIISAWAENTATVGKE
tara:strand:- start:2716 stop:3063 length:348 start_codon:yes stop_codon:yes gene_type:complete